MPNSKIKADAERLGKPVKELEALWKKAEEIASEDFKKDSDKYYPYVMGIYKNMTECEEVAKLFGEVHSVLFEDKEKLDDSVIDEVMLTDYEDTLEGGLADDSQPEDFDEEELKMGIDVEMEHTDDPLVAREIAMDHLKEIPDYYTRLAKMEKEAEADKETPKEDQNVIIEDVELECPHCGEELTNNNLSYDVDKEEWYHKDCPENPEESILLESIESDNRFVKKEQLKEPSKVAKKKKVEDTLGVIIPMFMMGSSDGGDIV